MTDSGRHQTDDDEHRPHKDRCIVCQVRAPAVGLHLRHLDLADLAELMLNDGEGECRLHVVDRESLTAAILEGLIDSGMNEKQSGEVFAGIAIRLGLNTQDYLPEEDPDPRTDDEQREQNAPDHRGDEDVGISRCGWDTPTQHEHLAQ